MKWSLGGINRKGILFVFLMVGMLASSCEDDDKKSFKDGREDYMGKIKLQITLPGESDTMIIEYNDQGSETGFPMSIRGQELTMSGIIDDTIRCNKQIQGMRVVMKHSNFQISSGNSNLRNFSFDGSAVLYFYPYKSPLINDTISGISDTINLKLLPIVGTIDGKKMEFQESSISESDFPTGPYMGIQFRGELIPF